MITALTMVSCDSLFIRGSQDEIMTEIFKDTYPNVSFIIEDKISSGKNKTQWLASYIYEENDDEGIFTFNIEGITDDFGNIVNLSTDYDYRAVNYYFDKYEGPKLHLEVTDDGNLPILSAEYRKRSESADICTHLIMAADYIWQNAEDILMGCSIGFKEYSRKDSPKETAETLYIGSDGEISRNFEDILADSIENYAEYSVMYRVGMADFSSEELAEAESNFTEKDKFRVILDNGESVYWEDIPGGSWISYGNLYEILARLGWDSLEGSYKKFSFKDGDNHEYEFTYRIPEECKEFFYIKDGERVNQAAGAYPKISADEFSDITGLLYEYGWGDEENNIPA